MALVVLAGGGGVYLYVRQVMLDAYDGAHVLAINSVLENVHAKGAQIDVEKVGFDEEFRELNLTLGVIDAQLRLDDGRVLAAASMRDTPTHFSSKEREVEGEGDKMIVTRRLRVADAGTLSVSRRAGELATTLALLAHALLGLIPLILLGTAAIGWSIAGRTLEPVRRAMEMQRSFMADASHELRTPLAVIRAQAEVQMEGEESAAAMRKALDVVARTSTRMSQMLSDLLFLAWADAGAVSVQMAAMQLAAAIEQAVEDFEPLVKRAGMRLHFVDASSDAQMEGYAPHLQRLVTLLMNNAVRHAKEGEIRVMVRRHGKLVVLQVEDDGPGISEELLPHVFDRFARGRDAELRAPEGHGLGLAIARGIVEMHRGTIVMERAESGGARVTASFARV